ncbi:MAG: hypothetical protein V4717_10880 [Bacteroidota bacterium]
MTYILVAFLIYLLYRFIIGFVIPVVNATSQVKKQFNAMHQQAAAQQERSQQKEQRTSVNGVNQKPKYDVEGEYIKFEEIKEK